jgi:myo-inositol catabolism protein IolC
VIGQAEGMRTDTTPSGTNWTPSETVPLLIMAMDHRESFGKSLFGVQDDAPTPEQSSAMTKAKTLIYRGLASARFELDAGRAGVLVDERYGQPVIDSAHHDDVVLAVPVERSGRKDFELEYGDEWLTHLQASRADYAKILVRDNPAFDAAGRQAQFTQLRRLSDGLREAGVPLIYELLVPATDEQSAAAGGAAEVYDRDLRPALVEQVIADNQEAGIEPALWKVEGLETADAARAVVSRARRDGRDSVGLIVLGRDAPPERLEHWLQVAAPVEGFVGFAIGRSIWEHAITEHRNGNFDDEVAVAHIKAEYLRYTNIYCAADLGVLRDGA